MNRIDTTRAHCFFCLTKRKNNYANVETLTQINFNLKYSFEGSGNEN